MRNDEKFVAPVIRRVDRSAVQRAAAAPHHAAIRSPLRIALCTRTCNQSVYVDSSESQQNLARPRLASLDFESFAVPRREENLQLPAPESTHFAQSAKQASASPALTNRLAIAFAQTCRTAAGNRVQCTNPSLAAPVGTTFN